MGRALVLVAVVLAAVSPAAAVPPETRYGVFCWQMNPGLGFFNNERICFDVTVQATTPTLIVSLVGTYILNPSNPQDYLPVHGAAVFNPATGEYHLEWELYSYGGTIASETFAAVLRGSFNGNYTGTRGHNGSMAFLGSS